MEEEGTPSEVLALVETQSMASMGSSMASTQGRRTSRWAYIPVEHWDPRFKADYEAFKAESGSRRHRIWLSWTREQRRLVYMASGPRSRKQQLHWLSAVKFRKQGGRTWDNDPNDDSD